MLPSEAHSRSAGRCDGFALVPLARGGDDQQVSAAGRPKHAPRLAPATCLLLARSTSLEAQRERLELSATQVRWSLTSPGAASTKAGLSFVPPDRCSRDAHAPITAATSRRQKRADPVLQLDGPEGLGG